MLTWNLPIFNLLKPLPDNPGDPGGPGGPEGPGGPGIATVLDAEPAREGIKQKP